MSISNGQAGVLVLVSSAVSAILVLWWTETAFARCNNNDEDDFEAHQGTPPPTTSNNHHQAMTTHVPYIHQRLSTTQIRRRCHKLLQDCQKRRTVRFFSSDPVPKDVIKTILMTACTAPSGAHKQPWTFVAIRNPTLKQRIRESVEREETINYQSRMRQSWVDDLKPMMSSIHENLDTVRSTGITEQQQQQIQKPYLTEAPWLIAVFQQIHGGTDPVTGKRIDHYYSKESVALSSGILCVAIQNANLVTLTSTPMGAEKEIRQLLKRPEREKLFLLLPVGFPAKNATVPYRNPERKPPSETIVWEK